MKKITRADLVAWGACPSAISDFTSLFGFQADVVAENIPKIMEIPSLSAGAHWAATNSLTTAGFRRWSVGSDYTHSDDDEALCEGCRKQWEEFVKIFNEENANEELFGG